MIRTLSRWLWIAVLIIGLGQLSCGSDDGFVTLRFHINDLRPDVESLRVHAIIDGKSSILPAEFATELHQITVKISKSTIGEGSLQLRMWGLDKSRCKIASAQYDTTVTVDTDSSDIGIALTPLLTAQCSITLQSPEGAVIRSNPDGIDCGSHCEADFPQGTVIQLSWPSSGGATATDWGLPCEDPYSPNQAIHASCTLTLTKSFSSKPTRTWASCPQGIPGWCWDSPLPQGNPLSKVVGYDEQNIWTVGQQGTIMKWNGTTWAVQSSGTNRHLTDLWILDPSHVWAVGNAGTVLLWDGKNWKTQDTGISEDLVAIWGKDARNIWVIDGKGTIRKWTGTAWVVQYSASKPLYGIWGSDAQNIWAV